MNAEAIYQRLPITLQNAVCSFVGWRIQRTRFGTGFHAALDDAELRETWSTEQLIEFRNQRLHAFVQHAAQTVPYYGRLFKKLGIEAQAIRTLDDLACLPILTKADVQQEPTEFESTAVPRRDRIIVHTSGTTGGGLIFPTTLGAMQEQWAMYWRFRRRHGIRFDTWCGYFGGRSVVPLSQTRPPFWRYNRPGRQILFSGYHIAPGTLDAYIGELQRRQPPWLHGYPSLLALIGGHLLSTGQSLGYVPQQITTGSENLHPHQAQIIEQALGRRPVDSYNLTEGVASMSQCRLGRLHVDEDFAAVEFLPRAGGGWRVVGSNVSNPAMPFLRYDVGDIVELDDRPCACGLGGRLVAAIDGRCEDYVVLRNGARLGRMDHIFKDMTEVREAQIYQPAAGKLVVRIVKNQGYRQQDEQTLREEFHKRVGDQADIEIVYVDSLMRSKQGKLRFVISDLPGGFTQVPDPASSQSH